MSRIASGSSNSREYSETVTIDLTQDSESTNPEISESNCTAGGGMVLKCPTCGSIVWGTDRCGNCGAVLQVNSIQQPSQSYNSSASSRTDDPIGEPSLLLCPNCGCRNLPDRTLCGACGASLNPLGTSTESNDLHGTFNQLITPQPPKKGPNPMVIFLSLVVIALLIVSAGIIAYSQDSAGDDNSIEEEDEDDDQYVPVVPSNEYSVIQISNMMFNDIYLVRVYFDETLVWGLGPIGWELDEYLRSKDFYEKYADGWTFPVVVTLDYYLTEGGAMYDYLIPEALQAWSVLTIFIDYDGVTYQLLEV